MVLFISNKFDLWSGGNERTCLQMAEFSALLRNFLVENNEERNRAEVTPKVLSEDTVDFDY